MGKTFLEVGKKIIHKAAALGFREFRVETRRSDVMAGGPDAAGSAPEVRQQPPGISGISQLFAVKKEVGIGISLAQWISHGCLRIRCIYIAYHGKFYL